MGKYKETNDLEEDTSITSEVQQIKILFFFPVMKNVPLRLQN